MSQANPVIGANKSGLDYRQDDNDGKRALLNHHKGSTAPDYAEPGIIWLDDSATPWLFKVYDGADWTVMGALNATTNSFTPYQGTAALRYANYAADTGSADAYAVAPVPALSAYAAGQVFTLKPGAANTGACTLAVSGLTAKSIKLQDGTDPAANAISGTGVYFLFYDGTNMVLLNPNTAASGGGLSLAGAEGLFVTLNTTTPNTQIDITADKVITATTTGTGKLDTAVSLTIDATTTGANGLDSGSLAASTWYYVWLISNGGTIAALLSTSSSAPTLPGGYTYQMLAGYAVTDSSTHFVPFVQSGNLWLYKSPVLDISTTSLPTSRTDFTLSLPTGKRYRAIVDCSFYATSGNSAYISSPDLTDMAASVTAAPVSQISMAYVSGTQYQTRQIQMLTNTAAKISARSSAGGANFYASTAGFYGRINAS